MRRGCGKSDGMCLSQFEASSTTGRGFRTRRDLQTGNSTAGSRQTGAMKSRRPFARALEDKQDVIWAMWAESPAHDRGTPSCSYLKDWGSEGLRRAWNQALAAVRPEYRRTNYASLSSLRPAMHTSDSDERCVSLRALI